MTKSNLIKKILQKLKVLETGEEPNADQIATVSDDYDSIYEELKDDGLVSWLINEDIPTKMAKQVILIAAGGLTDEFFVPEQRAQRLIIQGIEAKERLRELFSVPYVSTEEPVYF